MRFRRLMGFTLSGVGSLAILAGCSNGSQLAPGVSAARAPAPQVRRFPSWMRFTNPDAKQDVKITQFDPYVATMNTNEGSGSFVAQYGNYDPKGTQICALPGSDTDYIGGIAVDSSGNLYVPQSVGSGTQIDVYGPHCGSLANTLSYSGGNQPQGLAVYGNTVYAIDASYRQPKIQVFANGATSPTGTLSDSSIYQNFSIATDSNGDVFLSYYATTGYYSVIEFPGGTEPGTILPMTGNGPDGILIDKSNNLLYIIGGPSVWQVQVYAPPYTGSPNETIMLKGSSPSQNGPEYCALGVHYTRLKCGDDAYRTLDTYKYPSGKYQYSLLLPYSPYTLTYSIADDPTP